MITFILNREAVEVDVPPGTVLLDVLRRNQGLTGTKEGCREGDCGACMVLLGEPEGAGLRYRPVNSCLLPVGDAAGRHVVTIEGLNGDSLSPIQKAFVEEGATQCGFCTSGFIVSLTGFLLSSPTWDDETGADAVAGNICRCTGHVSIRRAVKRACSELRPAAKLPPAKRLRWFVEGGWIPEYFLKAPAQLRGLKNSETGKGAGLPVSGGTDLFVQRPNELKGAKLLFLSRRKEFRGIAVKKGRCVIGAATPWADLEDSPVFRKLVPEAESYFRLMASRPIRHRASVAGNLVNASPIGDLAALLLALDARVTLSSGGKARRDVPLKEFFLGYKKLNKKPKELVTSVSFPVPPKGTIVNFEKVSRRTNLDIASVNSAMSALVRKGKIASIHISAGGVAPVPFFLAQTVKALTGRPLTHETVETALYVAQKEIAPISDVRGSADYKRTLLRRLLIAHFLRLEPGLESEVTV